MSYHNLSNQEIVFLYLVAKGITEQYEEAFKDKTLEQNIPTESGIITVEHEIPNELVEELLKGMHYTNFKSIEGKLKSFYELIEETEPDMVNELYQAFPSFKNH
jgi:hypothetical protein